MPHLTCNLRQRFQHKQPLMHARVRNDQIPIGDHAIVKQQEIEIHRPWKIAFV